MCVARLMRGLSFRTIETVATETLASRATSRRLIGFAPRRPVRETVTPGLIGVGFSVIALGGGIIDLR